MLERLKKKSEQFREWAEAVQNALDPDTPKTCDLEGLRAHLKRAHDLKVRLHFSFHFVNQFHVLQFQMVLATESKNDIKVLYIELL